MPHRMATECVTSKQSHVDRQNDRSDTDSEMRRSCCICEPERLPYVVGEEAQENNCQIEKIPMNVLNDQRKRTLTAIYTSRLSDSASRRISPQRLVVAAAIVVAGHTEPTGRPQNQKRWGKRQKRRPPGWNRSKPAMRRVAKQFRRIEGRNIRTKRIVVPLKSRPGCVD